MPTYYEPRRHRWVTDGRKATNAEVRQAREAAFAANGGMIPCPLDRFTIWNVGPDKYVRLDRNGNAIGLSKTRYGR